MSSPVRILLAVVLTILGLATVCVAVIQLGAQIPLSPWEPSIAMEAMRLNAGLPIYTPDHATHLYGSLLTVAFAAVFRIFGLNFIAARIAMSIFAVGLAIFLGKIVCHGKSRACVAAAIVLFLAINFRTNLIVFSMQPDWAAVFLAIVAVSLWATRESSMGRSGISIALFVGALLFKQTAAAFAIVPFVYSLLWRRPFRLNDMVVSLIPLVLILLTLGVIRVVRPEMFAAMVTIPGSIRVYPARALNVTLYLFATFPIFLIALWSLLRSRGPLTEAERWILSALVVLVPISIWTMCKSGSGYNSLLFAYLAMTSLFVARLEPISEWLRSLSSSRVRFAAGIGLTAAILFSYGYQFDHDSALLRVRHGDGKYETAVALARDLRSSVACPQDPTIAWRANSYFGRSLYFELDTHAVHGNWPNELPASMFQELREVKHVVSIQSYVPTPMLERGLRAENFHPVEVAGLAGSVYTLWTKE